jgi:RNA polymerase sigma-70 factor (ECF subfamily)
MLRSIAKSMRQPPAAEPPRASSAGRRSTDEEDLDLIDRVAAGDVRAFEALYRAYHPRLTRFLSSMTARRPIVEESLNDTMLVVWRRAGTFNRQSKLSTWIFAIAYRTACKAMRWQEAPADEPNLDERAGEGAGPERLTSDRETRLALLRAMQLLSHEQRNVLVLTYFHDLPYADIAEIMDCPVDTVKTRAFHGRRRLRALLTGEAGDWL